MTPSSFRKKTKEHKKTRKFQHRFSGITVSPEIYPEDGENHMFKEQLQTQV